MSKEFFGAITGQRPEDQGSAGRRESRPGEKPADHSVDFHRQEQYLAALEAALVKQRAVNEVLFLLIIASPIAAAERDTARELYEEALKL